MNFQIRFLKSEDLENAIGLIQKVFNQFEAPEYSAEGVAEFYKYLVPEEMAKRLNAQHFCLVAIYNGMMVGIVEVRENRHISLLFVDASVQGRGIGKQLWQEALKTSRKLSPEVLEFTVNSSPFAVPIYEKLGFIKTSAEQMKNGIRFIPMKFTVTS